MGDVQKRRWLVQEQERSLLGQDERKPDPLALTARELVDLPIGEIGHPRILHGPPNGVVVLAGLSAQQRLVREATAGDEVPDGDPRRRRRGLGQKA